MARTLFLLHCLYSLAYQTGAAAQTLYNVQCYNSTITGDTFTFPTDIFTTSVGGGPIISRFLDSFSGNTLEKGQNFSMAYGYAGFSYTVVVESFCPAPLQILSNWTGPLYELVTTCGAEGQLQGGSSISNGTLTNSDYQCVMWMMLPFQD